jgi:hypothetical protein
LRSGGLSKQTLFRQLEGADVDKCEVVLHGLVVDGLVQRRGRMVQLSGD